MSIREEREGKGVVPNRKVYVKIKIERVQLLLEEAVLGTGCKTETGSGPAEPCGPDYDNCIIPGS